MKKLRYEAYMRKSSESSERQSLSIPAQKDELKKAFPDLNIVRWTEESRSAYEADNRPKFKAMLERIRKGEIDGVIAWKPNRLSRNALDGGVIIHYLNKGYIKDLQFASYTFEKTPNGIKQLQYELADSQYYSANLSVDVGRGNAAKRKRGWLTTANLCGYLNAQNPNIEEDPTESITVIDPERFPLIRKAWDLLLTGEYSVPMIQDIMNNQWGFRMRKTRHRGGNGISRTSLYHIFTNVRYAGKIPDPQTGELHDAKYPAMITVEEFNRAQDILGRRGKPHITEKRDFPFKGIAICGECGCSITAEVKKRPYRTYTYYHCTHKKKGVKCHQPSIEEHELVRQLDEFFSHYTIRKEFEEWGLEALKTMNEKESTEREDRISNLSTLLKKAEKRADSLIDMRADGEINGEEFSEKKARVDQEIANLREQLNGQLDDGKDWRKAMEKTLDILFNGRRRFENGDAFVKREVMQSLGSNIVIKDGKLVIDTYKWLEPIKNGYPKLEEQFDKVRTQKQQIKIDSFKPIRSFWRKREDSNLRSRCRLTRVPGVLLQPLGHTSVCF